MSLGGAKHGEAGYRPAAWQPASGQQETGTKGEVTIVLFWNASSSAALNGALALR